MSDISPLLHADTTTDARAAIEPVLLKYPHHIRALCIKTGMTVRALKNGERYNVASPAIKRLGVDVDLWPVAPAGLFVVEERTLYIRTATRMTIAHEFGHAIDCAIGGGIYHSSYDTSIRTAFASTRAFVTPYAATGLDEYFAEGCRAMTEQNDTDSPWPRATRARLKNVDPTLFGIMEDLWNGT